MASSDEVPSALLRAGLRYAQDDMKQLQITRCVREYAM